MTKTTSQMKPFEPLPLAERIREFRKRRGWNQAELAAATGVSQSQVSNWERGNDRPSPAVFAVIAKHAEVSERNLWLVEAGLAAFAVDDANQADVKIPVLRDPAAAGTPRAIDETSIEGELRFPRRWLPKKGSLYGMFVKGDSMSPIVNEGDLVLIDVAERDTNFLNGRMVAARDAEGGITIKWLRRDEGIYFLVPQHTSERHPIKLMKNDGSWSIVGEVVKIISDPPPRKTKG